MTKLLESKVVGNARYDVEEAIDVNGRSYFRLVYHGPLGGSVLFASGEKEAVEEKFDLIGGGK